MNDTAETLIMTAELIVNNVSSSPYCAGPSFLLRMRWNAILRSAMIIVLRLTFNMSDNRSLLMRKNLPLDDVFVIPNLFLSKIDVISLSILYQ